MKTEDAFAIVVKKYRKNEKLSQEQLAHICDFDRTYISLLERGKRSPSLSNIFKIAKGLNIKPSVLVIEVEELVCEEFKL